MPPRDYVTRSDIKEVLDKMSAMHNKVGTISEDVSAIKANLANVCKQRDEDKLRVDGISKKVDDCEKDIAGQKTFFSLLSIGIAALVSGLMRLIFK